MKTVTIAELKKNLDRYLDFAESERVHVTEEGEDKVVMLPAVVFEQMRKEFRPTVMRPSEIPEDVLKEVSEKNYSKMHEWDDDEPSEES